MRTMVLWCPDWSVTAGLLELSDARAEVQHVETRTPAACLHANRVMVCNAAARAEGVRRGQRRRDAQAKCPDVVLLDANADRDARWFEPVLAAVGLYGVLSYVVAQRTHEIGIRVALGASRGDVIQMILAQGFRLTGLGLVIGIAIAFGLSRVLATMLFGVSSTDQLPDVRSSCWAIRLSVKFLARQSTIPIVFDG